MCSNFQAFSEECVTKKHFFYFSTKTYVAVNIYPKLIMTETCNIYKLIEKNHGNFFKIYENKQNLYFKVAAILNIVCYIRPYI